MNDNQFVYIIQHDEFYYPAKFGLQMLRVKCKAWERSNEFFTCCGVDVLGNVHPYVHNDEYHVWKVCDNAEVIQAFEDALQAMLRLQASLRSNDMLPPLTDTHYIDPDTVCEDEEATDDGKSEHE